MKFEEVEVNSERWLDLKDFKNEVWKPIKNYENLYDISNYGRVKRKIFINRMTILNKEKILKCVSTTGNYLLIGLYKNGKCKTRLVHRLVAETFLNNENNYQEINHIDENKHNNRIDNLEWCNKRYNLNYGTRNERISASKRNKPRTKFEKVVQYDLKGNFIKEYENLCIAEKETEIRHIRECCDNKRKTTKGYIFKYKII